ncbi:hypothetical protein SESBI_33284 [Sesbania bispinosa]|nr:hypothetical protein SESBI_33284 [Sesbania bispinosa]
MYSIRKRQKRKRPGVNGIQPRESQKYCQVKLHWKVKEKLKGSGVDLLFEMAHKDIFRITGLPIDGKPVFALVRIPFLIPYVYKERDPQSLHNLSFPMMIEFTNIIGRDEMYDNHDPTLTEEFEALLLSVEEDDVRWTYEELSPTNGNSNYHQELLGYSVTTPVAPSLTVKHQPHLAPQQFPSYNPHNRLIQQWLEDLLPKNLGRKKKKGSTKLHKKIWEKRWNQLISKEGEVLTLMYITDEHDTQSHEPSSSLPSLPSDIDRSRNRKRTNDMEDLPTSTSSLQQIQWDHKGRGRQCCLRGTRCQRLNKKLLVLDINGLLAHIVYGEPEDRLRQPNAFCGKNARMGRNIHQIIDKIMGTRKNELFFYWPHTSVFPQTFTYTDDRDNSLGEEGELRAYLYGLAKAADMQRYVAENPFGQPRISQTSQH